MRTSASASPRRRTSSRRRRETSRPRLAGLLADVFALYMKTKNFHWHMSGPHFRDYHLLLDEHGDQIFAMTDPMAERARKIGGATLRSIGDISRRQRLLDNDAEYVDPKDMLAELRDDNKSLTTSMREVQTRATSTATSRPRACSKSGSTRPSGGPGFYLRRPAAAPGRTTEPRATSTPIIQSKGNLGRRLRRSTAARRRSGGRIGSPRRDCSSRRPSLRRQSRRLRRRTNRDGASPPTATADRTNDAPATSISRPRRRQQRGSRPSSPSISIAFERSSAAQVRKMLLAPAAVSRSTLAVSSSGCSWKRRVSKLRSNPNGSAGPAHDAIDRMPAVIEQDAAARHLRIDAPVRRLRPRSRRSPAAF